MRCQTSRKRRYENDYFLFPTIKANLFKTRVLTSFFFFFPPAFSFTFFASLPMTPFLYLYVYSYLSPTPKFLTATSFFPSLSVCKVGFYRSLLESSACSKCPPHSVARQTGATVCSCEDGYYKIDSDPPNMACTREDLSPSIFAQPHL